jgi:hypothetical protein
MRVVFCILMLAGFGVGEIVSAAKKPLPKPLRALLITGGCCHDYVKQKDILKQGLERRLNIVIVHAHSPNKSTKPPLAIYGNADYAKGFDLVIHDECSAGVSDPKIIAGVLAPHRKGIPGVNLHCAMHSYRFGNFRAKVKLSDSNAKWFEYIGIQSTGHGPQQPIEVAFENNVPFITKGVKNWTTQREELYNNVQVFPTAKVVARGTQGKTKAVVAWTNDYHGARVFSTSLGHNNVTVADPRYLNFVARGILWATKHEDWPVTMPKNESFDLNSKPKPQSSNSKNNKGKVAKVPKNAATGGKATASSEEKSKNNFAKNAVDGNPATRWCASGSGKGEWLQVDLGKAQDLKNLRILWEKNNASYKYTVEGSANAEKWQMLVDHSKNKEIQQVAPHKIDAKGIRYLKVTYLGSSTGVWGSLWEIEAHNGALPELPRKAMKAAENGSNSTSAFSKVKAPEGFRLTLFAEPPKVNYPVCITAASTGELFVGIDEQGSLGKEKGRGRVVRCIDTDGDGKADQINTFAKMDHPRGLIYDNGKLWVLHPPFLTLYEDTNGDGVADKERRLIDGISTEYVNKRGADHTTNGIRMGIDGWIYIAVGDFGFTKAVFTAGAYVTSSMRVSTHTSTCSRAITQTTVVVGMCALATSCKPGSMAILRGIKIFTPRSCPRSRIMAVALAAAVCFTTTPAGPHPLATPFTPATGAAARCSATTRPPTVLPLTRIRRLSCPLVARLTSMWMPADACMSPVGMVANLPIVVRMSVM